MAGFKDCSICQMGGINQHGIDYCRITNFASQPGHYCAKFEIKDDWRPEDPEKQAHYFTFGCGHGLANRYVIVTAYTFDAARETMFELFGRHWSMQYDRTQWETKEITTPQTMREKYGWQLFKIFDAGARGYDERNV